MRFIAAVFSYLGKIGAGEEEASRISFSAVIIAN